MYVRYFIYKEENGVILYWDGDKWDSEWALYYSNYASALVIANSIGGIVQETKI